jgi:hypothetical protein
MTKPDPSIIRQYFDYNPETGELRWRIGSRRRPAGELAGAPAYLKEKGRISVGFRNRDYKAHIIAWVCQTGEWPTHQIDHINEDPSDNRWSNLRQATKSENMRNITRIKSNTSGYKGVSFHKPTAKWRASIKADGIQYYLGLFSTVEEAAHAYAQTAQKLHGVFAKH